MLHTSMNAFQPLNNNTTFNSFANLTSVKRIYYCQRCLNHGRLAPRKNHKTECIYSQCNCEKCILVERRRVLNTQLHELEELEEQPMGEKPTAGESIEEGKEKVEDMHSKSSPPSSTLSSLLSSAAQSPLSTSSVLLATADSTINDFFVNQQHQSRFPSSASSPSGLRLKGERVPQCQKCSQHGRKIRLKGHKRFCTFKDCTCPKCQVITERQKLMADQIKIRRRQSKDTWMKLRRQRLTSDASLSGGVTSLPSPLDNQFPFANDYVNQLNQFYKNIASSSIHLASTSLNEALYRKADCPSQSKLFDNSFLAHSLNQQQSPGDYSNFNEIIAEKKRSVIAQMLNSNAFKAYFNEPVDFSAATAPPAASSTAYWPNYTQSSSFSSPSSNQSILDALLAKISQHQSRKEEISPPPVCDYSPTHLLPTTPLILNGVPMTAALSLPTLTTSPNQLNFSPSNACPISLPLKDEALKSSSSRVSPPCWWKGAEPNLTAQQLMLLYLITAQQNGPKSGVEEHKEELFSSSSSPSSVLFSQEQMQQLLKHPFSQ